MRFFRVVVGAMLLPKVETIAAKALTGNKRLEFKN
jgi:hypothetical protein